MKRIVFICSLLIVFLAGSISYAGSKTKLKDVWKDKAYQSAVKKIVVFCVMNDEVRRTLYESEFIRQLKARGVDAMPGYVIIPPDKAVGKDIALTKMRDLGADAVLTTRLIDKRTAKASIPDPDSSRRSGFYAYIYDVPIRDDTEEVYLETNLFDLKTEQRVWTARSETNVQEANQKIFSDYVELMLDQLTSDKMIK